MSNNSFVLSNTSDKPKFFYGYIIVIVAFVIVMVMWGIRYSFGVFFKPVSTEFGWARAEFSGAYSISMILFGLLSIGMGRLNDWLGPRLIMTGCGIFFGLSYLLMSQLSAIWQLYLFQGVLTGVGLSGSFAPLLATIPRWFVKRRGIMTGIVVSGVGLGGVIMSPLSNWIISNYGWRTSYSIVGIIAILLIVLAAQFLRREPGQLGQVPYGTITVKTDDSQFEVRGLSLSEAIHTKQFWLLCFIFFSLFYCVDAIIVHINPHATDLGISAASAANILAVIGGASIIGKLLSGITGDRIGNRKAIVIFFIVMSVSLVLLQLTKELWTFYLFATIFGIGFGGLTTLQSPIAAGLFGLRSLGIILGIFLFATAIGNSLGPLLTGHIFDITSSYHLAFLTCAGVAVLGTIMTLLLRPVHRENLV
ncbi:MFS transporter [Chloroflexota bacterium]